MVMHVSAVDSGPNSGLLLDGMMLAKIVLLHPTLNGRAAKYQDIGVTFF